MKILLLILMTSVFISCGKDDSSTTSTLAPKAPQKPQEQQAQPSDAPTVTPEGYTEIAHADPVELLNVTISERATVQSDRIIFSRTVTQVETGDHRKCVIAINAGDIWNLRASGNEMLLTLPDGSNSTLNRIDSASTGAMGTWIWTGKEDGMKITRRYTLLPNQLVLNQDCEG